MTVSAPSTRTRDTAPLCVAHDAGDGAPVCSQSRLRMCMNGSEARFGGVVRRGPACSDEVDAPGASGRPPVGAGYDLGAEPLAADLGRPAFWPMTT